MRTVLKWVLLRWPGWVIGLWSEITVDSAFIDQDVRDNATVSMEYRTMASMSADLRVK